jgi:hypothetical protein
MKPRKDPMTRVPFQRKAPRVGHTTRGAGPVKQRKTNAGESRGRRLVKARSGGTCEIGMCGGAPATDWSHRVRKGQVGSWSPVNGLHACRSCHSAITERETDTRAVHYGWALRSYMDPAQRPVYRRREWVWLREDGTYEPVSAEDLAVIGGAA